MATWEYELVTGDGNWDKPYWLDHAIGFVLTEDGRNEALRQMDSSLSAEARSAVLEAANNAIGGLMSAVDGVTALANDEYVLEVTLVGVLKRISDDSVVAELDLRDCDGAAMGFAGWRDGDFGDVPVAKRRSAYSGLGAD